MDVTLSRLLLKESFVFFQDSFAKVDRCEFEGSTQGVEFIIRNKMVSSIQITNTNFSKNSECISVVVRSIKNPSKNAQIVFKLTNSTFNSNVLSDKGTCISFTESPHSNQLVSFNISLENVTFSRNKLSASGPVFLKIDAGKQSIHLQNVTFIDNIPSSDRDGLTADGDSECVVRSTNVNLSIGLSSFTSQNARLFNVNASNISLLIFNSNFWGHKVEGNGGVISLRGTVLCTLNVSHSSFVNTTAAQGGAINVECSNVYSVSFQDAIFVYNRATRGRGGAVFIDTSGYGSNTTEYKTEGKAESEYHSQNGLLPQINIVKCNFTNAYSLEGAVYVNAVKASVQLCHSTFTNCQEGGGVYIAAGVTSIRKSGNDLVLIVESCHFIGGGQYSSWYCGGALLVLYKSQIQISINNSHFTSNAALYGGAICIEAFNFGEQKITNTSYVTIEHSTFSNNGAEKHGGAISTWLNDQSTLILQRVIMRSNSGGAVAIRGSVNVIKIQDSLFDGNFIRFAWPRFHDHGGALYIFSFQTFTSIFIANATFINCSAKLNGGAIYLSSGGNVSLQLKNSRFVDNFVFTQKEDGARVGFGGAIFLSLAADIEKRPRCIQEESVSARQSDDGNEFPSWGYKSQVTFEDTTFVRNAGYVGGAVYLVNGKATFRNCSFIDNFTEFVGGHVYTVAGSASVIIQDNVFRQTLTGLQFLNTNFSKGSFIHAESSGALIVKNTTMEAQPYGNTNLLLMVTNGRLIDVGQSNNSTRFNCPVGSQMEIINFANENMTLVNSKPCKLKVATLEFRCSACAGNSYSLRRGRAHGFHLVPGFQCLPCPFGANCSRNILAKPNFWGFKEKVSPPTLKFTMCPLGYCSPPNIAKFPEYNDCQGNRTGKMCGECKLSYTETLYSENCRPSTKCKDYWFWPVSFVYVSLMALYFTFKPPIVPWIKRQIIWFKGSESMNEETNFDQGYLKIIFYFYQVANLLLVTSSSQSLIKTKRIEPFLGLFNFQQKVSSVCPFAGFTVVTKQLFSVFHVFGTLVMICAFYGLHLGVQKIRGQGSPSFGPFMGGILQTTLLGYTTLASVSFSLLRCVPIGSEKRLFYDGNMVCFQWWQYILIAFICTILSLFCFGVLLSCSMGPFL